MGIASSIGGFFVEIGAKVDNGSFDKGEKSVANLGSSIKALVGQITAMSSALVGMATVAGTTETKNLKLAQSIGISAEKLDQWKMSASIAGTNADALVSSMDSIEQKMRGLKTGNVDMNLAKNLGFLDIGYSEFADMNADERMKAVIESARSMEDQGKASKLVADVLGEAGKDYYSYLQLSGKSLDDQLKQSKSLIFTDENSKREAMGFNAEIKGLFETMKSLGTYISSKIAGQLTPIVHKIKDIIAQNKDLIKSGISGFITGVGTAFNNIINILSRVAPIVGRLINNLGGLDKIIIKVGIGIAGLKFAKLAGGVMSVVQSVGLLKTALMGLGLGAITLLMEDLMTYLQNPSGEFSTIGYILENLDLIKEKLKFEFDLNFDDVVDSFKNLGNAVEELLTKATGTSNLKEALKQIGEGAGALVGGVLSTAVKMLQDLANALAALMRGDWSEVGKNLKNFFINFNEGITEAFSNNGMEADNMLNEGLKRYKDPNKTGLQHQMFGKGQWSRLPDEYKKMVAGHYNERGTLNGLALEPLTEREKAELQNLARSLRDEHELREQERALRERANAEQSSALEALYRGLDSGTRSVIGTKYRIDGEEQTAGHIYYKDYYWKFRDENELIEKAKTDISLKRAIDEYITGAVESGRISEINDGIISPNGRVTQVAPDDWVIAAKDMGNVASAFLPRNYGNSSMNAPITINQNFTFSGSSREFAPALRQQAYAGTKDALSQNFRNSQRILQQMSGTR